MTGPGQRDGFALPAALLALIVVGGLVTGGMYAAMGEGSSSSAVEFGDIAFVAAEQGLQELLGTKTRPYFEHEVGPVGAADTIGPVAIQVGEVDAQYTIHVQRLATRMFMIESEGEVLSGGRQAGSKRRLAEMMRIHYTWVPTDRALTTQEPITMRGQSGITGQDSLPYAWDDTQCPPNEGLMNSVVTTDLSTITVTGGGASGGTTGDRVENTALDSAAFVQYGDMHLDDLKAMAEKVYEVGGGSISSIGPSSTNGVCDTAVKENWGDPANPSGACHTYWPIIYAKGDLSVSGGGQGQGILIVDGNLSITGGFEFSGLVFIYGSLKASGTGNKLNGSVNILGASESQLGAEGASGNTVIQLSSCAIERAHLYNDRFARPIPLAERSFVDLSGIGAY